MNSATEIAPVVSTIEVARRPEEAFTIFTERLGEWWPTAEHSIGRDKVAAVVVDARLGGTIVERWSDGTEFGWATFTEWDPPRRFVMSWRPNPNPGPTTEVEVSFSPTQDGTIVELTHRGWERLGDDAADARRSYEIGWPRVMTAFSGRLS
jgi:uncharacterized protein YndB with AHSA1/START domain